MIYLELSDKLCIFAHKSFKMMEEDIRKSLEEGVSCRVNEPLEGALAYTQTEVLEEEARYDFNGKDFDLPITLDEVKAALKEADRELNKPEMWTSLNSFLSDFKQSHSSKRISKVISLFVVPDPHLAAGFAEGIPRDVEPAAAREQLVGILPGLQEVHEVQELPGVHRADIGSLTNEVLRPVHTTHQTVHPTVAESGIDDDGTDGLSGWFQQHEVAEGHVCHILKRRLVVGVFPHVQELVQRIVRR